MVVVTVINFHANLDRYIGKPGPPLSGEPDLRVQASGSWSYSACRFICAHQGLTRLAISISRSQHRPSDGGEENGAGDTQAGPPAKARSQVFLSHIVATFV